MKEMRVKVTFTEGVLGTNPASKEIYQRYLASKYPDADIEEELESLRCEEALENKMTIFHKMEDGTPFVYDYWIKGFFKGACGFLRNAEETESKKLKSYKKKIDGLIFVKERKIPFEMNGEMTICERSLRAETMQGPRTALAASEEVPTGSTMEFTVIMLDDKMEKAVREWLDYGVLSGMGQWRNSGKGRFTWEEIA